MGTERELRTVGVGRRPADAATSARANRRWWDADADNYHAEHGRFLGVSDFVWCPEGLTEDSAALLGPAADLAGRRVLEVGCGSAMCSRWLADRGAHPVGFDISMGMLRYRPPVQPGAERSAPTRPVTELPLVQADAQIMPFVTGSFDIAFSAYGAVPFVADSAAVMAEAARVLSPGGRWVFAVTHPVRWAFPDSPGADGLTATMSYFDRRPYVEFDEADTPTYVEHHRTLGDRVRELTSAGFQLLDLIEPEWPAELTEEWGGWSPLRGKHLPGTAIFVCVII
ncbi:MAG: Methyltransferase type 11 [Frankiales bacterium]|nr:Methyltransferase type 11 [Frankiales bacterium]